MTFVNSAIQSNKGSTVWDNPTFWDAERCAILRALYPNVRAKQLCRILECTPRAIYNQANRLGITKIKLRHDKSKV